jgi:hypothetical protein
VKRGCSRTYPDFALLNEQIAFADAAAFILSIGSRRETIQEEIRVASKHELIAKYLSRVAEKRDIEKLVAAPAAGVS